MIIMAKFTRNAIKCYYLAAPLGPLQGTLECRGTPFENHCSMVCKPKGAKATHRINVDEIDYRVPTVVAASDTNSRIWLIGCLDPRVHFRSNGTLVSGDLYITDISHICF